MTDFISIHALREEGDMQHFYIFNRLQNISIHALREEGDRAGAQRRRPYSNFYPRPPRGGRQIGIDLGLRNMIFLSTPSARRAT